MNFAITLGHGLWPQAQPRAVSESPPLRSPLEVLVRHHLPAWPLFMVFSTCRGYVLFISSLDGALSGWNFSGLAMLQKWTPGDRCLPISPLCLPSFIFFLYAHLLNTSETRDGRSEWDSPVGNTKSINRSFTIQGGELNLEVYSGQARNPTRSCTLQWQMTEMPRVLSGYNEPYGNPLNTAQ